MRTPAPATPDPSLGPEALSYVHVGDPGLHRRRSGRGFSYVDEHGRRAGAAMVARIRKLAIPPAWTKVWICAQADGHIQASGFDARGRRQYLYHPRFRAHRDAAKYERLIAFAEALPALRERVAADIARRGLGREKVLATVVHLLDTTLIRVGNDAYARENGSYGLTTLRAAHVAVDGAALRFRFKGKSGRDWRLSVRDRRVARIVRACQDLPGQRLFRYLDEAGEPQSVTSADVNAYLRQATGADITAKDFRTWAGTVEAAVALAALDAPSSPTAAKKALAEVIREVAARLGNTATICRKCYVHPDVAEAYASGELRLRIIGGDGDTTGLRPEEAAVLRFLRRVRRGRNAA